MDPHELESIIEKAELAKEFLADGELDKAASKVMEIQWLTEAMMRSVCDDFLLKNEAQSNFTSMGVDQSEVG